MRELHWFQLVSHWILSVFIGIMVYVTYLAYTRTSGSTGQDMSQIQKLRYEDQVKNISRKNIKTFEH